MDILTKAIPAAELERMQKQAAKTTPRPAPQPLKFVDGPGGSREMVVDLDYPVEVNGDVVSRVTIRRPSMREWRAYMRACQDAVAEHGPDADDLVDQPWLSITAAVLEELDFVDATRLQATMEGFFERSALPGGTASETENS